MNRKQIIGMNGENVACEYLIQNNYCIRERNFNTKYGEIDIIALDTERKELAFVEVKTRTNYNYGFPAEAVDRKKIEHIKRTINYYIRSKNVENMCIRIDVIEIIFNNGRHRLNHIKGII